MRRTAGQGGRQLATGQPGPFIADQTEATRDMNERCRDLRSAKRAPTCWAALGRGEEINRTPPGSGKPAKRLESGKKVGR